MDFQGLQNQSAYTKLKSTKICCDTFSVYMSSGQTYNKLFKKCIRYEQSH